MKLFWKILIGCELMVVFIFVFNYSLQEQKFLDKYRAEHQNLFNLTLAHGIDLYNDSAFSCDFNSSNVTIVGLKDYPYEPRPINLT